MKLLAKYIGIVFLVLFFASGLVALFNSPFEKTKTVPLSEIVSKINSPAMVSQPWGTEVRLKLEGVPTGKRCALVVYDKNGGKEIGGWWGTPDTGDEVVPGSTSFPLDQIDRMDIVADKSVLVTLRP